MATGTDGDELEDLKEKVRMLTGRIEVLSAQNSDLNSRLLKSHQHHDALSADLNARLVKAQELNATGAKELPRVCVDRLSVL